MATTSIQVQPTASLLEVMGKRYGLDPTKFYNAIQKTVMPSNVQVTQEQVMAFLVVANQYELSPFTKEIYAFPNKGGIVPIVSVDGWATIINRQKNLDGVEFEDHLDANGKITSITCRIYRKDRARPVEVTEYMEECKRPTDPWNKYPARMLRHKALIQAARYAFALTGIYDPDEAERIVETPSDKAKSATEAKLEKLKNQLAAKEEIKDAEFTDIPESAPLETIAAEGYPQ